MIAALFVLLLMQNPPAMADLLLGKFPIVPEKDMLVTLYEAPQERLPNQVKLLIWNVWKGGGKEAYEKDFRLLTAPQNIVLLEEGMENTQMMNLFKEGGRFGWVMGKSFLTEDGSATGVINGATARPIASKAYRSEDTEPVVSTPKTVVSTTYKLENGKELLVMNIHGLNAAPNMAWARQINQVFPILKAYNGPAVFAGDYNTWNNPKLNWLIAKMKSAGFTHLVFNPDPRKGFHLDHFFVKGCDITHAEMQSWSTSSDHYPVTVEINCAN